MNDSTAESQILIYGTPISSFTRKVLLALEYKGIAHKSEMPGMEFFKQHNPLAKMPIMMVEGTKIIDSSVICDFLEHRYPGTPALYPADLFLRARALWLEEYIDTGLQAAGYTLVNEVLFKPARYGKPSDPEIVEKGRQEIGERLDYLEQELTGETFVDGGFGIVEITLIAVLSNPLRAGMPIDAARWPRLAPYIGKLFSSDLVTGHKERYKAQLAGLDQKPA